MLSERDPYDGATLRWVEIAEKLRGTEVTLLHALALVRGVAADVTATTAIELSEAQVRELLTVCEELGDRVDALRTQAGLLPAGEFEIRMRPLQFEAEAALSAGVADAERAEILARCLPMGTGFQALAAALRCTDSHESWEVMTIGHLLGCFRDADPHLVRHLTGLATLSPQARWDECDRDQIGCLAAVLEQHVSARAHLPHR